MGKSLFIPNLVPKFTICSQYSYDIFMTSKYNAQPIFDYFTSYMQFTALLAINSMNSLLEFELSHIV